jgi:6-phospho-beta-glucosidase
MKAVFIGGGSHRILGIVRAALAEPGIFDGGEINLYDLDTTRSEAMGRMIQRTPEYARSRCKISWGTTLPEALDGADIVSVILMAGSDQTFQLGAECCYRHGFIPSDNVSPNGAFLAIKGAPILMNIAREMSRYCPNAWLINFANPIAVLSGMINNHTKIRCLGVCAGYTNHQWDLARILGKDEQRGDFDVDTAGVNHLSYILKGTVAGDDLFATLDRRLKSDWKMPRLHSTWPAPMRASIRGAIKALIRHYRQLGVMVFSTEGDGMMHLDFDRTLKQHLRQFKPSTPSQFRRQLRQRRAARSRSDRVFRAHLSKNLADDFWNTGWKTPGLEWAQRQDRDVFVEVFRGLSGARKVKVAATLPNRGAVAGFDDRTVLEYSVRIDKGTVRPSGRFRIPAAVREITHDLADHQTALADALATNDPRKLAGALLAYPIQPFSSAARSMNRELALINRDEIPSALRAVGEFL